MTVLLAVAAGMCAACDGGHGTSNTDAMPTDAGATGDAAELGGDDARPINISLMIDSCPTVIAAATPSAAPLGQSVNLVATGLDADGDTLTFAWSAPAGTFSAPASAGTQYKCTVAGEQLVTITVADRSCDGQAKLPVNCGAKP